MIKEETKSLIKDYYKKIKNLKNFKLDYELKLKNREKILFYLKQEELDSLDEFKFKEIISNLWATEFWTNKDYQIKNIIDANGITKIKNELIQLLYGKENIDIRFDRFRKEVKYIGPASITEILCFFDPQNYIIWNDKARKGLSKLKIENQIIKKYYINGKEYLDLIKLYRELLEILKEINYPYLDMLGVDHFLYEISVYSEENYVEEDFEFDHDEIRDKIKEIGDWLGFETSIEELIAKGAKVDVVWRAKIGNLGMVTYIFEVHKKGSIDSLILNLLKSVNNPTVQKIIAVSNTKMIEEIKKETENLKEDFKKLLTFWDIKEVLLTHENLSKVIDNINKLSLIKF
ncbi:MAG: hypothetical protein N3D74_03245 [Caldisericia bacterium]|nr:hypothetical protein [Caldisericia bacterium]